MAVDCDRVLRLSCDGEQATLTVKVSANTYKGLLASNYDGDDNPLALAAPGYVVELDNADPDPVDGMYTYVYTVKPSTSNIIDLQYLFEDYTVPTGMTLTGELIGKYKISIADGATVTLSGVTIDGIDDGNHSFAGISCLGSATLILAEGTTNKVKGFSSRYPGIYFPENETLTISGTGSLIADRNGINAGIGGYIGSNPNIHGCGNIVIESGNITATGCPGIGSSVKCGDITINGGRIEATGVSNYLGSPGIGIGGADGVCGAISITGGEVIATGDEGAPGIGAANNNAQCGDISITGGTVVSIGGKKAAGIGTGNGAICGNITIGANVTSVTARRGTKYESNQEVKIPDVIGRDPWNQGCGTITFGSGDGSEVYNGTTWSPDPLVAGSYGGLTLGITTTTETNDTWTLTPTPTE